MDKTINIDEKNFAIVREILKKNLDGLNAKTYVFGSRATGKNRKFSDVDIAIKADDELPSGTMAHLRCDFEDSNLDYFVDVLDLKSETSEVFTKRVEKEMIEFSY